MLGKRFLSIGLASSLLLGNGVLSVSAEGPEGSDSNVDNVKIEDRSAEIEKLIVKFTQKSESLVKSIERTKLTLEKLNYEYSKMLGIVSDSDKSELVDEAVELKGTIDQLEEYIVDTEDEVSSIEDDIEDIDSEDDDDDDEDKRGKGHGKNKEKGNHGKGKDREFKKNKLKEHKKRLGHLEKELRVAKDKYNRQLDKIEKYDHSYRSERGKLKKLESNIAKTSRLLDRQYAELNRVNARIDTYKDELERIKKLADSGVDVIDVIDDVVEDGSEDTADEVIDRVDGGDDSSESEPVEGDSDDEPSKDGETPEKDVLDEDNDVEEVEEISLDEIDIEEDVLARQLFMLNLYDLDK